MYFYTDSCDLATPLGRCSLLCSCVGQLRSSGTRVSRDDVSIGSPSGTCHENPRICSDVRSHGPRFANAGMNIATDIATTALPLPVLHRLQLPKRQKYIVQGVFALGGVYVYQLQAKPASTDLYQYLHHLHHSATIAICHIDSLRPHMGEPIDRALVLRGSQHRDPMFLHSNPERLRYARVPSHVYGPQPFNKSRRNV